MVRDVKPEGKDQPLTGVVTDREVYRRGCFEFLSDSADRTEHFAGTIGDFLRRGYSPDAEPWVFALIGELGAGKTCFTRGLAAGLHCRETPMSPTFTLIREYPGEVPVQHVDLCRLEGPLRNDDALLFEEVLRSPGVVAVEWADRYVEGLPLDAVFVRFQWVGENIRRIAIEVTLYRHLPLIREIRERYETSEAEIRC
jgi:tRNA threonylcarbamoyladenosine biosynthesis protein TsaE